METGSPAKRHKVYRRRQCPRGLDQLDAELEFSAGQIRNAYIETDPTKSKQRKGRNEHSWEALAAVGGLLRYAAGWAVDHETGKATEGLRDPGPKRPLGTKAAAEFDRVVGKANSVEMEKCGAQIRGHRHHLIDDETRDLPPQIRRQMLINILKPIAFASDVGVLNDLVAALEALNAGETVDLLKAPPGYPRGYARANLQLDALLYIEYQAARWGRKREAAILDVLGVFGRPQSDKRIAYKWREQAEGRLGELEVAKRLDSIAELGRQLRAQHPGSVQASPSLSAEDLDVMAFDEIYGLEQLREKVRAFKEGSTEDESNKL